MQYIREDDFMNDDANSVAQQYYNAMRRKAEGAEDLIGLFGQDAVYVEPFSNMGQATSHTGKDEIAAFIRAMPQNTPPDMKCAWTASIVKGRACAPNGPAHRQHLHDRCAGWTSLTFTMEKSRVSRRC
jgi:hypothetical protein